MIQNLLLKTKYSQQKLLHKNQQSQIVKVQRNFLVDLKQKKDQALILIRKKSNWFAKLRLNESL